MNNVVGNMIMERDKNHQSLDKDKPDLQASMAVRVQEWSTVKIVGRRWNNEK